MTENGLEELGQEWFQFVEERCGKKSLRRLGLLEYGWLQHHGESWTRNVRATPKYGISPYCGQFQLHITMLAN